MLTKPVKAPVAAESTVSATGSVTSVNAVTLG